MTVSPRFVALFAELRVTLGADTPLGDDEFECLYVPTFHTHLALRCRDGLLEVWSAAEFDLLDLTTGDIDVLATSLRLGIRTRTPELAGRGRDGMMVCARLGGSLDDHIRATADSEASDQILVFAGLLLDSALAGFERVERGSLNYRACADAKRYLGHV